MYENQRFSSCIFLPVEKGSLVELEIDDSSNLGNHLILGALSLPPDHWVCRQAALPTQHLRGYWVSELGSSHLLTSIPMGPRMLVFICTSSSLLSLIQTLPLKFRCK